MDIQGLRDVLRRVPFQPFEMRLADGRSLRVRHPEFVAVGNRRVFVVANDDSWSVVEPILIVSLDYTNNRGKGNGKARRRPRRP